MALTNPMANPFFRFKQFTVYHDRCAMKVSTDACLFGAWCAEQLAGQQGAALDIGTGTGLLSLMIAQETQLQIDAVEIDPAAALQATENRSEAGFSNVSILQGDIRTLPLGAYRIIFSNPPFYESELKPAHHGRNVAHHAGGLQWKELFSFISEHLQEAGHAFLLLPAKRRRDLEELLGHYGFHSYRLAEVHPTDRQAPARLMICFGKKPGVNQYESITIATAAGYTDRFAALLKPYYLYL